MNADTMDEDMNTADTPVDAAADFCAEGGCACAATRYRITRTPLFVNCCHCASCRRESGAAFAVNALVETAAVELLDGAPVAVDTPSDSGKGQRIIRCRACQVALWSHYGGAGDSIAFVRVGTLDEPARFPPRIHIYTASKQPWVQLPADVPATAGFYSRREHWPEGSLARLRRLRAGA